MKKETIKICIACRKNDECFCIFLHRITIPGDNPVHNYYHYYRGGTINDHDDMCTNDDDYHMRHYPNDDYDNHDKHDNYDVC